MIFEVAYIGNSVHHNFEQLDNNLIAPYTTWNPTTGINTAYLDPTTAGKAFYATNLLRPILGLWHDQHHMQLRRIELPLAANANESAFSANDCNSRQLDLVEDLSYTRAPFVPTP